VFLVLFFVLSTYGSIGFAGGAAIYWLIKGRLIMGFVLAAFAAYCGYELYDLLRQDIGKQFTGLLWSGVRNLFGLGLAVAVGGVGEFIRDRIAGRSVS
jgi:hypothetical protein